MSSGDYSKHAIVWDFYSPDRSAEVEFWARLARRYGRRVLTAMCATGKVAAGLAARGFEVTGVDITEEMILEGKRRYGHVQNLALIQGDIRSLDLSGVGAPPAFDFAFVGTSSFHHLQTASERSNASRSFARQVRHGGGLGLELWFPPDTSRKTPWKTYEPLQTPDPSIVTWKRGKTEYDASSRVISISQEVFIEQDGESERFEHAFRLQLFGRESLMTLLNSTGFHLVGEYGSYESDPWVPEANKWLIEAVRE